MAKKSFKERLDDTFGHEEEGPVETTVDGLLPKPKDEKPKKSEKKQHPKFDKFKKGF